MGFSLIPRNKRYVLVIGDEAVVLVLFSGTQHIGEWSVNADPDIGAAEILDALDQNRSVPISVLIDAFEQHFREEKVPKVNVLDQAKVVRRHLQAAYPGNNLEGAIPQGQDPDGNRYWLFMAVPPTSQVEQWLSILEDAGRPAAGVHSLPLESLEMLDALTPAEHLGGVRWKMLFSFDLAGGLRQIISKQGRMVVTRLTPPPAADSPIEPAMTVMRDFAQTLTYIKRLGYQKGDQLDVVMLANGPLADHLREQTWDAHSTTVLSPYEAAIKLGIARAVPEHKLCADTLHAGLLAGRRKPRMSLRWANAPAIEWRRLILMHGGTAALIATVLLFAGAGFLGMQALDLVEEMDTQQANLATAERRLNDEMARQETLPYTPTQMRETLALGNTLTEGDIAPLPLLQIIDRTLGLGAVATTLQIATPEPVANTRRRRPAEADYAWQMTLGIRFAVDTADDAQAVSQANALLDRLATAFPDSTVRLTMPPVAINPDQTLRGGAGLIVGDGSVERTMAYAATYEIVAPVASAKGKPHPEEGS